MEAPGFWDDAEKAQKYVLELNAHLGNEQGCAACAQFYQQADYEGEGEHGSRFAITAQLD